MRADAAEPIRWLVDDWHARDLAAAIARYRADGFAVLPRIASDDGLARLREQAEAIMGGHIDHTPFFFQHDAPTGRHEDAPLGQGWVGPSPAYRKIEKLERDPVFRAWLGNACFEAIARAVIGPDITLYRAILMTKAARVEATPGGTELPWHQDAGALWGLDRDPVLQLWTALDDATVAAGCMAFAAGTHQEGLASPLGGVVPPASAARHAAARDPVMVPVEAGDVVLIHNHVWHASGRNTTERPRRGFSVCFMDATTRCTRKRGVPRQFPRVFSGDEAAAQR